MPGPALRISVSDTLAERVRAVIELRGRMPHGRLRISEVEGAIVLEGEVPRFYDRQVALACAQHVPGVRRIVDRISVCQPRQ